MWQLILAAAFTITWQPVTGEPGWPVEYVVTRNADTISVTADTTLVDAAPVMGQWNEYRVAARYAGRPDLPPSPWSNPAHGIAVDWTHGDALVDIHHRYISGDSMGLATALLYNAGPVEWGVTWLEAADSFAVTAVCPWDLNADGLVDLSDLSVFALEYGDDNRWTLSHFSGFMTAWRRPGWYLLQAGRP